MRYNKSIIVKWLLLPLMFVVLSGLVLSSNQGWINNSLSLKIDSKVSLKFTNEIRYDTLTYLGPFMKNWNGGIVYKLPKNFYLSVAYKRESTEKTSYTLQENRFTLETGWKTKLSKKATFDVRFRTEIRTFEKDLDDNHLRFRLRLRFKTAMSIGKLKLKPFIAIEPFGDTKKDNINRYRFYVGTVFSLSKHVDWVVNFIRQGTKDKETIDILNTGVELKF